MLGKGVPVPLSHHHTSTSLSQNKTLFLVMLKNVEKLMESTFKEHNSIDISGEGILGFYKLITSKKM
jgi:hypothetical protein